MDTKEIRMRCIEAAARTPTVHSNGHATGVLETASLWFDWIISAAQGPVKASSFSEADLF